MVWTQPMTFTANTVLTAAQLNVHLRDNLMASEASLIQQDHDYIVSNGYHTLARRQVQDHRVTTSQTTTSTEYTDLATVGPTVTVETSNRAWIIMTTHMQNSIALGRVFCSFEISRPVGVEAPDGTFVEVGQNENAEEGGADGGREAHDNWALMHDGLAAGGSFRRSYIDFISSNLTPGQNTFTMKYRVGSESNTGTFTNRQIIVIPM